MGGTAGLADGAARSPGQEVFLPLRPGSGKEGRRPCRGPHPPGRPPLPPGRLGTSRSLAGRAGAAVGKGEPRPAPRSTDGGASGTRAQSGGCRLKAGPAPGAHHNEGLSQGTPGPLKCGRLRGTSGLRGSQRSGPAQLPGNAAGRPGAPAACGVGLPPGGRREKEVSCSPTGPKTGTHMYTHGHTTHIHTPYTPRTTYRYHIHTTPHTYHTHTMYTHTYIPHTPHTQHAHHTHTTYTYTHHRSHTTYTYHIPTTPHTPCIHHTRPTYITQSSHHTPSHTTTTQSHPTTHLRHTHSTHITPPLHTSHHPHTPFHHQPTHTHPIPHTSPPHTPAHTHIHSPHHKHALSLSLRHTGGLY